MASDDECVTCASTLDVLKLVASADFARGVGGYGLWGPRLRAETPIKQYTQTRHSGVQARALSVGLHASDDWEILAYWIGLRAFVSYKPLSPPKKINRQLLIPSLSENPLLLIPTPGDPSRYQAGGGMDHF
jgi:hypothetical protein